MTKWKWEFYHNCKIKVKLILFLANECVSQHNELYSIPSWTIMIYIPFKNNEKSENSDI